MNIIRVYDPPMCCSSGVCGTDFDPNLANFASMLTQLGERGVKVERFNLGQRPMAFVENATVKGLLEKEGADILPLVFLNDDLAFKGRYPNREERADLIRMALGEEEAG